MRPKPKRASLIRMIGREILKTLPTYEFDNSKGTDVPVTAARKFIRKNKLQANVVVKVTRVTGTIDRFYWCDKGLFGADYAEWNYVNFEELRSRVNQIEDKGLIYDMLERTQFLEVESFHPEYR